LDEESFRCSILFQFFKRHVFLRHLRKILNAAVHLNHFITSFAIDIDLHDRSQFVVFIEEMIEEMLDHIPLVVDDM
jgi:hypothetical protein